MNDCVENLRLNFLLCNSVENFRCPMVLFVFCKCPIMSFVSVQLMMVCFDDDDDVS